MDALLPSEIARLVLGYLQEQKCEEAAKMFMESSSNLHECRIVAQKGGRYSTKVGGLSLIDILDKYCAANAMVQEKLDKVSDCEQLKQCSDLLEQLRFLLDGSRGHRFVVNINMPSQNVPNLPYGSPNVTGSSRKRHHSSGEKSKRVAKSLNNLMEKTPQKLSQQVCDTVEATPLESLPGHKASAKLIRLENHSNVQNKSLSKVSFVPESTKDTKCNLTNSYLGMSPIFQNPNSVYNYKDQGTGPVQSSIVDQSINKCTAGTSTEELLNYCTTEVQTPSDFLESESDINDEPIENLSILTKKLLERTEIHERIAESINRTVLPVETSFREDENPTDVNTRIITDLDTAIKSVVEATETDPVFEGFLREVFEVKETGSEDSDTKINEQNSQQTDTQNEPMDFNFQSSDPVNTLDNGQKLKDHDPLLKQRLRNSLKSQNFSADDEEEGKVSNSLEDQNAEAIMSIVANVIANKKNTSLLNDETEVHKETTSRKKSTVRAAKVETVATESDQKNSKERSDNVKVLKQKIKKKNVRKQKECKPKFPIEPEFVIEEEKKVGTMPTLIFCAADPKPIIPRLLPRAKDGYIPIVPKPVAPVPAPSEAQKMIYLRTVNVPRQFVNTTQIETSKQANQMLKQLQQASPQKPKATATPAKPKPNNDPIVVPIILTDENRPQESITLYSGTGESDGGDSSGVKVESMPIISLDESAIDLVDDGFSSSLKKNPAKEEKKQEESTKDQTVESQTQVIESIKIKDKEIESIFVDEIMKEETKVDKEKADQNKKIDEIKKLNKEKNDDAEKKLNKDMTDKKKIEEHVKSAQVSEDKKKTDENTRKAHNARVADTLIMKRTPKSLLEDRSKNNRLSLSTPRRHNSHVRALDFDTPIKTNATTRKMSQSCTKSKSVCRSSLFKSPPFTGGSNSENKPENSNDLGVQPIKRVKTISPVKGYKRVPIATRSPAPKLQGNWNKIAGIGTILAETSASESSPEKVNYPPTRLSIISEEREDCSIKEVPIKKSWDSDLRQIVGSPTKEEEKSAKKITKKSTGKRKSVKPKQEAENSQRIKKNENSKKNDRESRKNVKMTPQAKRSAIKTASENKKNSNSAKISPETFPPVSRLPNILDLETPRKFETLMVPPTPRVFATPGNHLIKSNRSSNEFNIKDCVNTPDFPVTPCIILTPKIIEEEDHKKSSPYYEPSDEQPQTIKEVISAESVKIQQVQTTVPVQKKNIVELQESRTVEITSFGVVEEDKSSPDKDEKEITSEENSKEITEEESIDDINASANSDSESDTDSDSNSSTSSSSSNSSSSDSSSCSSNNSSPTKSLIVGSESQHDNSTTESEFDSPSKMMEDLSKISKSDVEKVEESGSSGGNTSTSTEEDPSKEIQMENSPVKVFSITEEGDTKETPAKDESNSIPEAEISETPSVTGADRTSRFDSLTNLTSKISAIITTSSSATLTSASVQETARDPEMTKVQNIALIRGKNSQNTTTLLSESSEPAPEQQTSTNQAKLSSQLEEKRQRVLAKFKQASNLKPIVQSLKRVTIIKKKVEAARVVNPSAMDHSNNRTKQLLRKMIDKEEIMMSEKASRQLQNNEVPKQPGKVQALRIDKKGEKAKEESRVKNRVSPRKKVSRELVQATRTATDDKTTMNDEEPSPEKNAFKPKADQAKRDPYDQEQTAEMQAKEQRTTRSQTARKTVDNQKTDEGCDPSSPRESLPGVLECLQLIPANKSDSESTDTSSKGLSNSNSQTNTLDISLIYDDSVPIKKRKRKYSSSELESEYIYQYPDEEIHVSVSTLDEMLKIAPRNTAKKKPQSPKKSLAKEKKMKDNDQPLATSSPLKSTFKTKKTYTPVKKRKTCKRKASPVKEERQVEKKSRPNPLALLNEIKFEDFLKSVHVPKEQ